MGLAFEHMTEHVLPRDVAGTSTMRRSRRHGFRPVYLRALRRAADRAITWPMLIRLEDGPEQDMF
jgi:hypothetical protein